MKALELKIIPAILFGGVILLMIGADYLWPIGENFTNIMRLIASLLMASALLIGSLGIKEFLKVKTTINPEKPETTTTLVTDRIYAISRNPMYLALLLILVGILFLLANPALFLGPVFFILYMGRFQITPEERAMQKIFGDEYHAYCRKVRRWI